MLTTKTTYGGTGEQPWFVINATEGLFQHTPQVEGVSHIYRFQAGQYSDVTLAIPDGCVDIMFDCSEESPSAKICGSTLSAQNAKLRAGHTYFGVRFVPGTLPKDLDLEAKSLIGQRFNLFDFVHDDQHLLEQLIENDDFITQAHIIERHLSKDVLITPSPKTRAALDAILQYHGNIQINHLEDITGISKRTLQRLFLEELGLSPKAFCRIIRCQSAISQINHSSDVKLIELANDLGFSDQPHFMREFKKLIHSTPGDYQRLILTSSYNSKIQLI